MPRTTCPIAAHPRDEDEAEPNHRSDGEDDSSGDDSGEQRDALSVVEWGRDEDRKHAGDDSAEHHEEGRAPESAAVSHWRSVLIDLIVLERTREPLEWRSLVLRPGLSTRSFNRRVDGLRNFALGAHVSEWKTRARLSTVSSGMGKMIRTSVLFSLQVWLMHLAFGPGGRVGVRRFDSRIHG
jgi:hypothetical protein